MSEGTPTQESLVKEQESTQSSPLAEPVSPTPASASIPENDVKDTEDKSNKINVTVKTQRQKEVFQVDPDINIKDFKELISKKFDANVDRLNLIFAGKIMKNDDTLNNHNVKDGLTVHLVVRAAVPSTTSSTAAPTTTSTPQTNQFGGGLLGVGLTGQTFVDLQQRLQDEIQTNPNLLEYVLQNPLTQVLMNDPDNMSRLILNNPQMQQLIEQNPDISHVLNNRELLRQTMDMVRNPAALQEMMRSHDRAMTNLESLPGGYQALERIYHDIQEPMLNNLTEQLSQNPFVRLATNGSNQEQSTQQQPANQPNREPLPNPWSTTTNQTAPTPTMPSIDMIQQMGQNTELMRTFFETPYAQELMSTLISNPPLMNTMIRENPLYRGQDQETQQYLQNIMPHLLQQLQTPETQNMLTNPDAMNAMLQIQEGLNVLRQNAPSLLNPEMLTPTTTTGGTTPDSTSTPIVAQANQSTATPTTTSSSAQQQSLVEAMARVLSNMSNVPLEQRYASQLNQLESMGFTNRQHNLQILTETYGNVEAAIERLLMHLGN